ncbi:CD1375 family protein [Clostridium intestinale]|nr:CD1375 family protein [Clostridium intestinale]WRY53916.1 CD1375 family protein [Clostridium intestinale]
MVKLYVDLIQAGLWTIDKVPSTWKTKVEDILNKTEEED